MKAYRRAEVEFFALASGFVMIVAALAILVPLR
jgi:hypothetical protein